MNARKATLWLFLWTLLIAADPGLRGQSTTGTVYGAAADPSGAVIPGATITIRNTQTGVSQVQITNGSGEYVFPTVTPGSYTVTSSASGFKSTTATGVAVAANQNVHVPFALVTGGATETVEVEAGLNLVDHPRVAGRHNH